MPDRDFIIGISASPRKKSNSDFLLDVALSGIKDLQTKKIKLINYNILPCLGCNYCHSNLRCFQKDDMFELLEQIKEARGIIFSTPVYFYSVPGHAKIFIDRFQPMWQQKKSQANRQLSSVIAGAYISVAGTGGQKSFECIRLPYKYMLNCLDAKLIEPLVLRNHDTNPEDLPKEIIKNALEYGRKFSILLRDKIKEGDK